MNAPILSSLKINLPSSGGKLETFVLSEPRAFPAKSMGTFNRVAYSAAHVVADPRADIDPWIDCALDWDTTLRYREFLWDLGLGVAEAMDTAQRGMGLDWPTSLELIKRAVAAGKAWEARNGRPALIASGCGTDHIDLAQVRSVDEVIAAYEEQMAAIEAAGGKLIIMASRALARIAKSPADYERVYDRVLSQAKEPVVIHWLGEMFDPALAGYWGSPDHMAAMKTAVAVINAHAAKVDGVKISLLDKDKEIAMRRQLPKGVRMYTGDQQRSPRWLRASGRSLTKSWSRPSLCRATSSKRLRASTKRASCSWRTSTVCRITSSWSGDSRARVRSCTSPNCSGWPIAPACCTTLKSPAGG